MTTRVRSSYYLSTVSWFLLFGLLSSKIIQDHSTNELPRSLQLILFAGPLLLVLMGLLKGRPKTHLFAAVLAIIYFCGGVTNTLEPATRIYGGLLIIFSFGLFAGGVMFARWASQEQKANLRGTNQGQSSSN